MVLTRQTPQFAELATLVEMELEWVGATIPSDRVDFMLNAQIEHIAQRVGVSPRKALDHAPADLVAVTARALTEVANEDLDDPSDR